MSNLCPIGSGCQLGGQRYADLHMSFNVAGIQAGYLVLRPLHKTSHEQNDIVAIPITLSGG